MKNEILFGLVSVEEISNLLETARVIGAKEFLDGIPEEAIEEVRNILTENELSVSQAQVACLIAAESMKFK